MAVRNTFEVKLRETGQWPLLSKGIDVLQVNLGRRCNQACRHCHVEAGPARPEAMGRQEVDAVLGVLRDTAIGTLDLTGGAPELHPDFEYIVSEARALGCRVIDRCNLTVLLEPGKEHLVSFLRDWQVEIIASMPCYLEENVDSQRGAGVFSKSLKALRRLNAVGYGQPGSGLVLNLVYNPGGAFLPSSQPELEAEYRDEFWSRYGIVFSRLYTMTNMPIGRFGEALRRSGEVDRYWHELRTTFNPDGVEEVMCRQLISVGWDGTLYDCDFNQVLGIAVNSGLPNHIEQFNYSRLSTRPVATAPHCFGCTAGQGSSCGGALV